jgi:glutamate-1-semialdehyde 2,1-aminomutase
MDVLNEGYKNTKHLFKRGYGSKILDKNNQKFLDLTSAGGTSLLGHNNSVFINSVKKFINNKYSNFALPNAHAINFSYNLRKIFPQFTKFIFCNSGAEANMKAIRIARAVTKKDKIINISGSWHGSIDQFLFSINSQGKKISLSSGLEKKIEDKIIYAPYNNFQKTKKIINKHKKEICCVIIEPIQGCLPSNENMNYLSSLSNFCKKKNIILILDEIITGLRTDCSSVQNKYALHSDISTFGKVFGNGLPIGFIGVSKKIEKKINKNKKKIFFGGTFSGNSFSTYVANETLKFLVKNKKKVFNDLEGKSKKFSQELSKNIIKKKLHAKVIRFKSVIRIIFTDKNPKNRLQRDFLEKKNNLKRTKFINFLKRKKIIFPSNGIIFLNISLSMNEINFLIKTITDGLNTYFK